MTNPFQILDLTHARNIFAVGDIHGCFSRLEEKFERMGFDPDLDHIVSVGDLIDRGPESHRALEFCRQPWFHWVKGNHEQLLEMALEGQREVHKRNGGLWLDVFNIVEQDEFNAVLNDAPVIMEVLAPSGRRYGIVHACFPSDDWRHAPEIAANPKALNICLWDRTDVHDPKPNGIRYIDHVFHGHTPLGGPRTVANVTWLDTGACFGGELTVTKLA